MKVLIGIGSRWMTKYLIIWDSGYLSEEGKKWLNKSQRKPKSLLLDPGYKVAFKENSWINKAYE